MDIFTKVATAHEKIKEASHTKEAFLGKILSFAVKKPIAAASALFEANEVKNRTQEAGQAVRAAKNRSQFKSTVTRV